VALHEVTLELDRALRQKATTIDNKVKQKEGIIEDLSLKYQTTETELNSTRDKLKKSEIKYTYVWFAIRTILLVIVSVLIYIYIKAEIITDLENNSRYDLLTKFITILAIPALSFTDYINFVAPKVKKINEK
jgi:hypothetical protein